MPAAVPSGTSLINPASYPYSELTVSLINSTPLSTTPHRSHLETNSRAMRRERCLRHALSTSCCADTGSPIPSEATVHLKPIGLTIRRGMCHWMRSMTSPDLRPRNPPGRVLAMPMLWRGIATKLSVWELYGPADQRQTANAHGHPTTAHRRAVRAEQSNSTASIGQLGSQADYVDGWAETYSDKVV